jgi:septal ring factor EnvC (AmiA/AmiB activator)
MKPLQQPPARLTAWLTARRVTVLRCAIFYCTCSLLFSPALYSQEPPPAFTSIDSDLLQLENLINDTLSSMETQQQQLDGLRRNLSESETLIASYETITAAQEQSLKDLQARLAAMSETYKTQSALSAQYAKSSKFWKVCTLIAVPAAALAGILTGLAISR